MSILSLKNKQLKSSLNQPLTTQSPLHSITNSFSTKNKNTLILYAKTNELIEEGQCLFLGENSNLWIASSMLINTTCIGISLFLAPEKTQCGYKTNGIIKSNSFSFSAPYNKPLYVSARGFPTENSPTRGYTQIIGYSVSNDSFIINIQDKILL